MHKTYPAILTDGTEYTGNQQFKGFGIQRYCPICASWAFARGFARDIQR